MIKAAENNYTQVFIEAPHHAAHLLTWLMENAPEDLYLSLSIDLSTKGEKVHTHPIKTWRTFPLPSLAKKRVTYLLGFPVR